MGKTGFEDKKIRRLPLNKLAVPVAGDIEIINIQDIIRCEADGSYTHLFVQKRKLMISKTLKLIERRMKGFNFLRVHQHHLVNLNHVVKYTKGKGGYLVMTDGSVVEVSLRLKKNLIKMLYKMGI